MFRLVQKKIFQEERGQAMLEYLVILLFTLMVIYGLEFSFKDVFYLKFSGVPVFEFCGGF